MERSRSSLRLDQFRQRWLLTSLRVNAGLMQSRSLSVEKADYSIYLESRTRRDPSRILQRYLCSQNKIKCGRRMRNIMYRSMWRGWKGKFVRDIKMYQHLRFKKYRERFLCFARPPRKGISIFILRKHQAIPFCTRYSFKKKKKNIRENLSTLAWKSLSKIYLKIHR